MRSRFRFYMLPDCFFWVFHRGISQRRRQHVQRLHVVVEPFCDAVGERRNGFAIRLGGGINFIVHIGDVAHIRNLRVEVLEQPVEHIIHHHRTRVADMRPVIDRGATHIHAHVFRVGWGELLLGAREGVVEL